MTKKQFIEKWLYWVTEDGRKTQMEYDLNKLIHDEIRKQKNPL